MTPTGSLAVQTASADFARYFDSVLRRALVGYRPLICPFDDLLALVPSGGDVLDVGCGNSLWLYLVHSVRRPKSLAGVDVNEEAIAAAKKAFSSAGVTVSLLATADPEMWPGGTFDAVTLIDVLHHVPPSHQESFFGAVASRVRPGGYLIYKDMCRRPIWRAIGNQLHDLVLARQWVHHVDVGDVEKWAGSAGLVLEASIDRAMYWYGHELRRFKRLVS